VKGSAPLFSSQTGKWATPNAVYQALDDEFHFTFDPCPMDDYGRIMESDGLAGFWTGQRVFCNPPYGPGIGRWLAKAREAECAVYLLPSRTETRWWHDYALKADEIRFIRGRLKFKGATNPAPFPSCLLIYQSALLDTHQEPSA
jgi:hypothetical protein